MKKLILSRSFFRVACNVFMWHVDHFIMKRAAKPLVVGVFLTNRCNLQCRMCSIWRSREKAALQKDDIIRLVDAVSPGCCYFSFSGGEPLLVKDIFDMIRYASKKIPYVHLVSNGLLIDGDSVRELAAAGLTEISLSLDGEEDYHNSLRGNPRGYAKVREAIETIKKNVPKMKIVLNSVIFPGHFGQVRHVVELAGKLRIYAKVQPVNRHFSFADAPDNPPEIEFGRTDRKELSQFIQYLENTRHVLNSRYYLRRMADYLSGDSFCELIRPRCRLPHYFLEANPFGLVSPCMYGTGWEKGVRIEEYEKDNAHLAALRKSLETCRLCDETMYICYWEPLINMPVTNFIAHTVMGLQKGPARRKEGE